MKLPLALPSLLLLAVPLGAGGQNMVMALVSLLLISDAFQKREFNQITDITPYRLPSIVFAGFLVWMVAATLLNPANPNDGHIANYLAGYLPVLLLPPLLVHCSRKLSDEDWHTLFKVLLWVACFMALICISQAIFGWRRDGFNIIDAPVRARALYSHPLTLAYISILIWPFALYRIFKFPRHWQNWLLFGAVLVLVWTSRSRIIQIIAVAVLLIDILYFAKGKLRLAVFGVFVTALLAVTFTKNEVSDNFRRTIAGTEDRHAKSYPDDRVAFWHAHWELFKERPISGHGVHLPKETRLAAYDKLGLSDFKKKYSAHNSYLQIATEGGLIGLILFLVWYAWYALYFLRQARKTVVSYILAQSWVAFGAAMLTQNAFQDTEVRYCFTLLLSVALCKAIRKT